MLTRIVMPMAACMCIRTGMTANTITLMSRWRTSTHIVMLMVANTCMRMTMQTPLCTMPTVRMSIRMTVQSITATARPVRMRRG